MPELDLSESISAELLRSCPGVGPVGASALLRAFGTYAEIIQHLEELDWRLGEHPARRIWLNDLPSSRASIEARIRRFLNLDRSSIITSSDERYPPLLREIADPPLLIYCLGDISLLQKQCISIVGTRKMTPYGKAACALITREFVRNGYTIVSGMADGIDCEGHQTSLDLGGNTIAVLGTGVKTASQFSPRQLSMHKQIYDRGLLISEVAPDTPRTKGQYPQRNRIIAGLSRKTIVIEAPERSGALITAWLALDENRDVLAVPGPITSENSRGCHKLLAAGAEILWDLARQSTIENHV